MNISRALRQSARGGFTLIELLAVIVLGVTILGMATVLLGRLLRLEQEARRNLEETASLARWAREFRRDAHRALSVDSNDDLSSHDGTSSLSFLMPDGQKADYRADGSTIEVRRSRSQANAEEIDELSPIAQQEQLTLSSYGQARLMRVEQGGTVEVHWLLLPTGHQTSNSVRVIARVGRGSPDESKSRTP